MDLQEQIHNIEDALHMLLDRYKDFDEQRSAEPAIERLQRNTARIKAENEARLAKLEEMKLSNRIKRLFR